MAKNDDNEKTEKTSTTRQARTVSRTGRNNGGDGDAAKNGLRAGVMTRTDENRDTGDRETARVAELDKVWTSDSKEVWGADQPSLQDQLKAQRKVEEKAAKREK